MKQLVGCILLLLAFSAVSFGQAAGIRGGVQQTTLLADEAGETFGTETGLSVGGFLNVRLPANLGISVEGMYTQKLITQQNISVVNNGSVDPDVTLHLGTIEIPITLFWKPRLARGLYSRVYGGPLIGVIVDEQVDVDDQSIGDVIDEAFVLTKDAFAEREVGWIGGAGLTFSLTDLGLGSIYLLADVRYQSGITTVDESFAGNPLSREIRVGAFTALLGVGF